MTRNLVRLVGTLILCLGAEAALHAQSAAFRVVVHSANPSSSLARADLARLFLKKTSAWPDGRAAAPVDLGENAPARRAFSKTVLERDVSAVRAYWQQQIFSGRGVPPVEKGSDADVLAYVRANPGAVGYVSAGVELGASIKELRVE